METIIKYICLPFTFSAEALLKEVQAVAGEWLLHYNTTAYEGEWKALPLRTIGGTTDQHLAQGDKPFADTILMNQCPLTRSILDRFACEKLSVRLLNLRPAAVIKEHKDPGLAYEEGLVRIHIPVTTNKDVSFIVDNEEMALQPGSCWYMNFDLPHRLANNGTTDRIHLVIDCIVNDWIHQLFARCTAENVKRIPAKEKMSIEDKYRMLEHLENMNTPTSQQLAHKLRGELATSQ